MPAPYTQPVDGQNPQLRRPLTKAWLAGVCAGISDHTGMPTYLVRLVAVTAAIAGPGAFAYLFLWATVRPSKDDGEILRRRPLVLTVFGGAALVVLGVGMLVSGENLASLANWQWLVPSGVMALGAVLVYFRLDMPSREDVGGIPTWVISLGYAVVGAFLVTVGVLLYVARGVGTDQIRDLIASLFSVLVGLAVVAGPWLMRLWNQLADEQSARASADARADVAAHLHDSVLQTLALIQRHNTDAARVGQLARQQERELRTWLYGKHNDTPGALSERITAVVEALEDEFAQPVELVITGDRQSCNTSDALTQALREATGNALKHGAQPVSVYVEIGSHTIEAFVRDHGQGFDLADLGQVPASRLGLRESIIGRMQRCGGTATIRRRDPGTEVALIVSVADITTEHHHTPGAI